MHEHSSSDVAETWVMAVVALFIAHTSQTSPHPDTFELATSRVLQAHAFVLQCISFELRRTTSEE